MVDYRTSGPWGAGIGANLTPEQVDGNFYQLVQMINAKAVAGVGIANMVVSGNELWVTLTDHTLLGPYTLPVIKFNFVGQWQANTVYPAYTIFTYGGSTYEVLVNITSAATFDPGANDGMGNNYYGLLLSNAPNALPAGGSNGMVLTKAGSLDYGVEWGDPTLAGLFDVQQSPGPTTGQLVFWNGSIFSFISTSDVVGAPPALTSLSDVLSSPAPTDGQVVTWSATDGAFTFETAGGGGASALSGLSDVSIATSGPHAPTVGQILSFGGPDDWQNLDITPYQAWTGGTKTLALTDVSNFIDYSGGGGDNLKLPISFASTSTIWVRQQAADDYFTVDPESGVTLLIPPGRIAQPRTVGSVIALRVVAGSGGAEWEVDGDLAYATPIALTTTGTFGIDPSATDNEVYSLTPTGSLTLNCSTFAAQQRLTIIVTTSGTTPYTITFGTGFKSQGTLVTGAVSGKVFVITFIGDGANMNEISRTTAM